MAISRMIALLTKGWSGRGREIGADTGAAAAPAPMAMAGVADAVRAEPKPPSPAPPPMPYDGLVLSREGCISEPEWLRYLGALYEARLHEPLRAAGTPPPHAKLWVCAWGTPQPGNEERLRDSWLILSAASEYPVELVTLGDTRIAKVPALPSLSSLAACAEESDLVMFVGPGDEVRPETHMALKLFGAFFRDLTLFDAYVRHSAGIYPVLHHGVDAVHARCCDYFFSRFCITTRALRQLVQRDDLRTPREVALAFFEEAGDTARRTSLHVGLPLVCIDLDVPGFRRSREALALAGREPAAEDDAADRSSVSAIICTKDNAHLLRPLVHGLLRLPSIREVVIVSNNTSDPFALALLEQLHDNPRVQVLRYDRPFNFSAQCNLGASFARSPHLLFLNDDTAPSSDDWLPRMLDWVRNGSRCVVGPLLLYPDETVQHGGMYMGFMGVAGHALRREPVPPHGLHYLLSAPRQVSVLTGAALLMPRTLFDELNGFDPLLATYLQDVDLSLRALRSGAKVIFEPRSILFHMESVSLTPGLADSRILRTRVREHRYFLRRWASMIAADPWMNPRLDPADESWRTLRI